MANVLIEEQTMSDIAAAIREKNGTDITYKPAEMPQAVREIASIQSDDIKLFNYYIGKDGFDFSDLEVEHLIIELPNYLGGTTLITTDKISSSTKEITLKLSNKINSMGRLLYGSLWNWSVEIINIDFNTSKVDSFRQVINYFGNCKTINGVFDFSNATTVTGIFSAMPSLVDVRFAKETLKLSIFMQNAHLSDESIQSIIDGLADLTGQDSQVLTLNKTLEEKITDEQKAYVVSKNWQLAFS